AGYQAGEKALPTRQCCYDVNVRDFGARGDGTQDDAPAIQAAIDAAEKAGGGTVRLPAGHYKVSGQLVIGGSRILLRGAGPDRTVLLFQKSLMELQPLPKEAHGQSPYAWNG